MKWNQVCKSLETKKFDEGKRTKRWNKIMKVKQKDDWIKKNEEKYKNKHLREELNKTMKDGE